MNIEPRKGFAAGYSSLLRDDAMAGQGLRKVGKDAQQRVPTKALTEGEGEPLYVSAKRTHRFGRLVSVYLTYLKILISFAGPVCSWVRFGKRTHRGGVLGWFH
jgi:hypothetical protein